jgi:hypothetical protein
MAFPTCLSLVIPATLSADSINLCVESKIDEGLNDILVDSLLVYCELIWLNSVSNEPTPPPGVALYPAFPLYLGDVQTNCPSIPPPSVNDLPAKPKLSLFSFPSYRIPNSEGPYTGV